MLTIQQKAQCVLWYHKLKSPTAVERKFRNEFGQDPPHTNSIKRWFKNFMKTGSILDCKTSCRPSIDEETVDAVRVAFHRSPRKSIRVASNKLAISQSTVHKVLHKRLWLNAYKLQIVQALKARFHYKRGKEHSLFVLLIFFALASILTARFNRRSIKEIKNTLFHARSGNGPLSRMLYEMLHAQHQQSLYQCLAYPIFCNPKCCRFP